MTPPSSDASYALAPDGTHSAYTVVTDGVARLWVRSFNFGFAQALAGTEDASTPFWSSDDSTVGLPLGSEWTRRPLRQTCRWLGATAPITLV